MIAALTFISRLWLARKVLHLSDWIAPARAKGPIVNVDNIHVDNAATRDA